MFDLNSISVVYWRKYKFKHLKEKITPYIEKFSEGIQEHAGTIITIILAIVIGIWLVKKISRLVEKQMDKRELDQSVKPFLKSVVKTTLYFILFVTIAGFMGIKMTSFVAVIGAGSFAAGLALQGSLANFAGGVLILILRPFKVGDYIHTAEHDGIVREIQIFYTYITTFQNQEIMLPNGALSNNSLKNYSFHKTRRMDLIFGIGYGDSMDQARKSIQGVLDENPIFLKQPAPQIYVENLNDSSVDFKVWVWVKTDDFWPAKFCIVEDVKKAFDRDGVSVPFPQRDVHMIKEKD